MTHPSPPFNTLAVGTMRARLTPIMREGFGFLVGLEKKTE
jgi:hypothetical protein